MHSATSSFAHRSRTLWLGWLQPARFVGWGPCHCGCCRTLALASRLMHQRLADMTGKVAKCPLTASATRGQGHRRIGDTAARICVVSLILVCSGSWVEAQQAACKGDASWAASLTKAVDQLDSSDGSSNDVADELMLSLGTEWDEANAMCIFSSTPPLRVKFTGNQPSDHQSNWSPDVTADPRPFRQLEILTDNTPDDLSEAAAVWRYDIEDDSFTIKIRSTDVESVSSEQVTDTFRVSGRGCSSPLPITGQSLESNPKFKCMMLALHSDDCTRKLGVGTTGRKFEIKFDSIRANQAEAKRPCHLVDGTRYMASFSPHPRVGNEEDRSFNEMVAVVQDDGNTPLPGKRWGYRTSNTGMMIGSAKRREPRDEGLLEVTVQLTDSLRAAWSHADSGNPSDIVSRQLEEDELSRQTMMMDLERLGVDDDVRLTLVLKRQKCSDGALGDDSWGVGERDPLNVPTDGWEELTTKDDESNMEYRICLRPAESSSGAAQGKKPCDFFTELANAAEDVVTNKGKFAGAAMSSVNRVHLALGKKAEGANTCLGAVNSQFLELKLKHDLAGPSTSGRAAWHVAEAPAGPIGGNRAWAWKVPDVGHLELSFKPSTVSPTLVFSSGGSGGKGFCGDSAPGWGSGLVLEGQNNGGQQFDCVSVSLIPAICDHALGLAADNAAAAAMSFVAFELSLAPSIDAVANKCDYTQSFSSAFTDEIWQQRQSSGGTAKAASGEADEGAWRVLYVDAHVAPSPNSWRWRSTRENSIVVAFDLADGSGSDTQPDTIELHATQACSAGVFPNLQGSWEVKTTKSESAYQCVRFATDRQRTSALFKQTDLFERLVDMTDYPYASAAKIAASDGSDQSMFGSFEKLLAKGDFGCPAWGVGGSGGSSAFQSGPFNELFEKVKVPASVQAITSEGSNLRDSFKSGALSHFSDIDLPSRHPLFRSGKIMHTQGFVARARFIRNPRQIGPAGVGVAAKPYTGVLATNSVPMLIRYSPSNLYAEKYIPGWAFKFFRDETLPADDVVAYHSLVPQDKCDIFESRTFSNIPVEGLAPQDGDRNRVPDQNNEVFKGPLNPAVLDKVDCVKRYLLQLFTNSEVSTANEKQAKKTSASLNSADVGSDDLPSPPHTLRTGVAHLFLDDGDAWANRKRAKERKCIHSDALDKTVYPDGLVFVAVEEAVQESQQAADLSTSMKPQDCRKERKVLAQRQLQGLKTGTRLFDVYALRNAEKVRLVNFIPQTRDLLGSVVIEDPFVESWGGDMLHFKHEPFCPRRQEVADAADEAFERNEATQQAAKTKVQNAEQTIIKATGLEEVVSRKPRRVVTPSKQQNIMGQQSTGTISSHMQSINHQNVRQYGLPDAPRGNVARGATVMHQQRNELGSQHPSMRKPGVQRHVQHTLLQEDSDDVYSTPGYVARSSNLLSRGQTFSGSGQGRTRLRPPPHYS